MAYVAVPAHYVLTTFSNAFPVSVLLREIYNEILPFINTIRLVSYDTK